jgi:hypothetical protein
MAAACQEDLDEVALNPVIEAQTSDGFCSSYGPAADDAGIDYRTVEPHRIVFTMITRQTGDLGQ